MNPWGWILESTWAIHVKGSSRTKVYVTHSRRFPDGRREYLCHDHSGEGIVSFEAHERELRRL